MLLKKTFCFYILHCLPTKFLFYQTMVYICVCTYVRIYICKHQLLVTGSAKIYEVKIIFAKPLKIFYP